MAYKKIEKNTASTSSVTEINTEIKEQESPAPISDILNNSEGIVFRTKEKIPMDALIMVKNVTGGKLVYESKRIKGYSVIWDSFGDEVPMEMSELYAMKSTDRRFFTENWIEVNINVLRDLQMDLYYEDAISIDEINSMFKLDTDTLVSKISKAKKNVRNAIGLKAIEMIKDRKLTDINVITALEKALGCELYER